MNKTEILAALRAANVPCDDAMTVPVLKELAAAHNVSLVKSSAASGGAASGEGNTGTAQSVAPGAPIITPEPEKPAKTRAAGPSDEELINAKVAAGLRYEQAVEVVANQRSADAAAAGRK